MSDKLLHVRVAEALGCKPEPDNRGDLCCFHDDSPHARPEWYEFGNPRLARYDTDWSATGPLIERYGIRLDKHIAYEVGWTAWSWRGDQFIGTERYASPLVAVCNLILALQSASDEPPAEMPDDEDDVPEEPDARHR